MKPRQSANFKVTDIQYIQIFITETQTVYEAKEKIIDSIKNDPFYADLQHYFLDIDDIQIFIENKEIHNNEILYPYISFNIMPNLVGRDHVNEFIITKVNSIFNFTMFIHSEASIHLSQDFKSSIFSLLLKIMTPMKNNKINQFIVSNYHPYYKDILFANNLICSILPQDIKNIIFLFFQESMKENTIDCANSSKELVKLGLFQPSFAILKKIEMQEKGREFFLEKMIELFGLIKNQYSDSPIAELIAFSALEVILCLIVYDQCHNLCQRLDLHEVEPHISLAINDFIQNNPVLLEHPKISKEELLQIITTLQQHSLNFDFLITPRDSSTLNQSSQKNQRYFV